MQYFFTENVENFQKVQVSVKFVTSKGKKHKILQVINMYNRATKKVVIDAGHGGSDVGEKVGSITEADLTLEYAKLLKENLEANGYKVKLTRDDNNTGTYTYTNMYDSNGRISIACSSKAKLMISFHINNGYDNFNGFEIYAPCKSNLNFAGEMADKIKKSSSK